MRMQNLEPEFCLASLKIADSDNMYELLKNPSNGAILQVSSEVQWRMEGLIGYPLAAYDVQQWIIGADVEIERAGDGVA